MTTKHLCLCLAVLLGTKTATADNWPQWRGPKLDSVSSEKNLPDSLDESSQLWKFEMPGPGGASPIVWGDRIFVASVEGADLVLLCLSTDGELKWKQKLEGRNKNTRDKGNSASPSPVTDGQHVWVMLSPGIVHCFDFDGKLVWKKSLQKEYGRFDIQFGMTSSPILDNGVLYFQLLHGNMRSTTPSIGKIVALNARTGEQKWEHIRKTSGVRENKHSYASPTIFRNDEKSFLIVHGADFVTGHDLDDGKELWRVGGFNPKSSYNDYLRFVSSPVCNEELIVVPSAKSGPVFGILPSVSGNTKNGDSNIKWKLNRGTPDVATPVISGDRIFLARENGVFICLDAANGEKQYEKRIMGDRHRSTPVVADGKVYVVSRDGNVLVIGDQKEFKLISQSELGEDTTASPAVSNGRIYVRTNKSLRAFGKK